MSIEGVIQNKDNTEPNTAVTDIQIYKVKGNRTLANHFSEGSCMWVYF